MTSVQTDRPAPDFQEWPKIPRLNRGMVITEKIDGTNAAVVITPDGDVFAQSRNRMLTDDLPDNYGFRAWAYDNAIDLAAILGPGYHFGEWWGSGIQRRYGLTGEDKRFSLFNTARWEHTDFSAVPGLGLVPVLHVGPFSTEVINSSVESLRADGSVAVPGFMKPEGVVVYLSAARQSFKVTLEKDSEPKSLAAKVAA